MNAQQVWENASAGQAFITRWTDQTDGEADVVWVKGDVDTLDWSTLVWMIPIDVNWDAKVY